MQARPLVLGHRGASTRWPENTLAAFAGARELGADGVELDVRRTADDELVVLHDPELDGYGLVVEHPFARLRAERPDVPTLSEALDACAGLVVNVEIKCLPWDPDPDTPEHDVARAVVDVVRGRADVILSSFDVTAIDACHSVAPDVVTAWLTSGQDVGVTASIAAERGHSWLHPDRVAASRASLGDIARAHELGLRVNVWTVDNPNEARALAAAGVDGIITNVPDVVLRAFA